MIKISIIIPIYNVEKYIQKCIYSAYNQRLNENEFEIIAVDDESPDNSLEILKDIKKEHSNINIISQKNKGLGGARNTGVLNASGEYLLFLDADDYYVENSLKEIYLFAKKNNLDILEFGSQGVDANGNIIYDYKIKTSSKILSGIQHYNKFKYANSACNKLYKRSFLEENKLFFVEKIFGEDFEFNTRALYLAKRTLAFEKIVACFLQSDDSITRTKDINKKKKYINDLIDILQRVNTFRLHFEMNRKDGHDLFFNERMAILNIDIFVMMVKNKFQFSEILKIKRYLKTNDIFKTKFPVTDRKKNLFRIVFLNFNFLFFGIAIALKNVIKK